MKNESVEYKISGEAKDHEWLIANRELLESHLFEDMRFNGLIPVIDKSTGLTFDYKPDTETFTFELIAIGYPFGEGAKDWLGILLEDGILVSLDFKKVALCDGI